MWSNPSSISAQCVHVFFYASGFVHNINASLTNAVDPSEIHGIWGDSNLKFVDFIDHIFEFFKKINK
jgi:hypothetical protein